MNLFASMEITSWIVKYPERLSFSAKHSKIREGFPNIHYEVCLFVEIVNHPSLRIKLLFTVAV